LAHLGPLGTLSLDHHLLTVQSLIHFFLHIPAVGGIMKALVKHSLKMDAHLVHHHQCPENPAATVPSPSPWIPTGVLEFL
jgi:hypothetical protein